VDRHAIDREIIASIDAESVIVVLRLFSVNHLRIVQPRQNQTKPNQTKPITKQNKTKRASAQCERDKLGYFADSLYVVGQGRG
jgi:hypothetical protein